MGRIRGEQDEEKTPSFRSLDPALRITEIGNSLHLLRAELAPLSNREANEEDPHPRFTNQCREKFIFGFPDDV